MTEKETLQKSINTLTGNIPNYESEIKRIEELMNSKEERAKLESFLTKEVIELVNRSRAMEVKGLKHAVTDAKASIKLFQNFIDEINKREKNNQ